MNMKSLIKNFAIFTIFSALYALNVKSASAYSYPIRELGYCRDQKECHTYCEIGEHKPACWSYSVYSNNVLGESTPEAQVSALGITFPITELGGCRSVAECKSYCTQAQNLQACQTFAENKGLKKQESIIAKAQEELGCQTREECQVFCSQAENKDACEAFAKKFHLKSEVKDKTIEMAKTELGCQTREECYKLCQQPQNLTKCQALSQKLKGNQTQQRERLIERAKQELGCTTFEACKAFCQDEANHDKCRNFGQAVRNDAANKIKERLGCTTNEECRKACEANPEKCPNFPKRPLPSGIKPSPFKHPEDIHRGSYSPYPIPSGKYEPTYKKSFDISE